MAVVIGPLLTSPSPPLGSDRASLDAYWTPIGAARACCASLRDVGVSPRSVLEPAVGGGAWVQAARETWPGCIVDALDIDPEAPGLALADAHLVLDFRRAYGLEYSLVLGNPPYGGDLQGWVEHSMDAAQDVAYLLRGTFLGSVSRAAFFRRHRPTDVWVLAPRPKWGGPGARTATDTTDSILVLWRRDRRARTDLHWLEWK